jgi:hypothetical protein
LSLEGLALIVECPAGVLHVREKLEAFCANRPIQLRSADADALDVILQAPEKPFVVTPTFFLEVDRRRLQRWRVEPRRSAGARPSGDALPFLGIRSPLRSACLAE